jgi:hypothetical protein
MNSIVINNKEIIFFKEILQDHIFKDIIIIIFEVDKIKKDVNYNNVIALNLEGMIIWEVEEDGDYDFINPYEGVTDLESYIVLFKANSQRVAINKLNGKILKNLSPINKSRPY